jgi:ketosteroid isomerase-like protein
MKKRIMYFLLVTLLLLCFAFYNCNAQHAFLNIKDVKKTISKINANYFHAFASGNSALFVDCYTQDCWIMPPNTPTLCGRDAPFDFFEEVYKKMGVRNGKFVTMAVYPNADGYVTEIGSFQLLDNNKRFIDEGKYLVLWKKTASGWKRFRDSFSSNHSNK